MNEMNLTTPVTIGAILKNAGYVAVFVASMNYLGLAPETVLILAFLILLDMVTGVLKSLVVYGPASLTSARLTSGLLSKLLLILVPTLMALAGKGVGIELGPLAQASVSVLILSQTYSILGNIHAVQTKSEKNEFDAVAYFMKAIRDVLEKMITTDRPKNPEP